MIPCMKQFIYADNAATTKLDADAFEAMLPWLRDAFGNASQPYAFARKPKKALAGARAVIASCIGAEPGEIFFTSCGSESDNWALKASGLSRRSGETFVSAIEHHAILNTCLALERDGHTVKYLPVNSDGVVLPEVLETQMSDKTRLVSVMTVNNEIGTIEPIRELALVAHRHGALFHTDAVQAVGHVAINVHDLGVDMLSASAHKFNGPKGIGFLYVGQGTEIRPLIDGGAQEARMRAGTENVASVVAMACALKKNCELMEVHAERLHNVETAFLDALSASGLDFIRNGAATCVPGNVNISIRDASGEMLLHRLDLKGICISTGSACDSVNTQVSHVIQAIGVPEDYAEGTIRISFGRDNTEEEAVIIANAIRDILVKR